MGSGPIENSVVGMVSISIPTYLGARWIRESIESALAQSYPRIEILVVDDASTDETVDVVRAIGDPRVRLAVNENNLGLVGNWHRCLELARGAYVKFLFQDDLLEPDCVARMVEVMERSPRIGLVFSRRHVLADGVGDRELTRWMRHYSVPDERFGTLTEVNDGRELFERAARHDFRGNWVGEPSCVMVRTAAIERVGGFNARMVQTVDWEMWLRLMFYFDVGFISQPLATYRLHVRSESSGNRARRAWWTDLLWLVEGLREHPEIRSAHPELGRVGLRQARRAVVKQVQRVATGHRRAVAKPGSGIGAYVRHRLSRRGATDRLHAPIRHG
jgi:glycosyltransferase involved in cell wall biosynthesis